jgi:uncharacterized protein (TIGR03000 family)
LPNQATIVVSLPDDATLTIDGVEVPQDNGVPAIVSPALERGRDYYYTLKARAQRDGRMVAENRRVTVRAGAVVNIDFGNLVTSARR